VITALGGITCKRAYKECRVCLTPVHPADEPLGIDSRYTVGLRRLAVMAGTSWSFDQAAEKLEEFCGIKLCDNTIRELCQKESVPMGRWQRSDPVANAEFTASEGDVEFTTDGTSVNTTEGWREMRVAIFAKRNRGTGVHADQWADRKLPKPHVSVAFAGIEGKDKFRHHWDVRAKQLNVETDSLSVLADGAPWIWDSVRLEFGKVRECLDVYHALEHLSATGKILYGEGTEAYERWREETTLELMWNGFVPIERRLDGLDEKKLSDSQKESIRLLRGYLGSHAGRLGYRERLAEGSSIGSGQVEGACKNLIGRRLKQVGAKWRVRRVNRMATLCAVLYGGQWKLYWKTAV
jgi:hypothetical protein